MESTLFEIFDPVLTKIDAVLVQRGTPLSQRPFDAAVLMVRSNIFEFSTDGGKTQYVHDGTAAFAKTEWFRSLYKKVDEWYTNRYGSTLNQLDRKALTGVVLIFGTPFQLEVQSVPPRQTGADGLDQFSRSYRGRRNRSRLAG